MINVISIMDKLRKFNLRNQFFKILGMEQENLSKKMNMNMLEFLIRIHEMVIMDYVFIKMETFMLAHGRMISFILIMQYLYQLMLALGIQAHLGMAPIMDRVQFINKLIQILDWKFIYLREDFNKESQSVI